MIEAELKTKYSATLEHLPLEKRKPVESTVELLDDSVKSVLKSIKLTQLTEHLPHVLFFSQYFSSICKRYPSKIAELITSGELESDYDDEYLINIIHNTGQVLSDHQQLEEFLRITRHVQLARIIWRELSGVSETEQTIRDLSNLADGCLQICVQKQLQRLSEKHGQPFDENNKNAATFVVFALGKLGGKELNFSSDIDLVFAFSVNGVTQGEKSISNNEFFIKLGQSVINSLNEITKDGQVYRVDMRLRPNGQSGPLALSFSAMENYYQIHGREWERYAWIKARAVAGDLDAGKKFLNELRPFVYRKYLDYQVYESLDDMKSMINKEIRQQGMQNNIKLGRGGIREIEFIVQSHQLVQGGRDVSLRTGYLKSALRSLEQAQLIDGKISNSLYQAYLFLRTVEHRLQMKNDQQTHQLPVTNRELNELGASMGFEFEEFSEQIEQHRNFVQTQFSNLYQRTDQQAAPDQWQDLWNEVVNNQKTDTKQDQSNELKAVLSTYVESKTYRSLEARGRKTLDKLIPKILQLISAQPHPTQALNRTLLVISSIGGRTAYLSLLDQFPIACKQLVQLCGASPWVSKWIANNPIVLDTLINPRTDLYSFNHNIENLIERRLSDDVGDELNHDILRQIHHSCILQIAVADLQSQYNATEIRGFVSKVAQAIINQVVKLCQRELQPKFGLPVNSDDQGFGVIAYGKLGSIELSYNADLDLVFIFDDQYLGSETQGGRKSVRIDYYFSRLVQRILTMLSMQTSAGKLYDVDTRLRPSGRSGLLVSSIHQYEKYQREQAWLWEHQALVKARLITQNSRLESKFNQLRKKVLSLKRDDAQLKSEIHAMRQRMRDSSKVDGPNYKIDHGGMIDIEFITQYLVLKHAHIHPDICQYRSVLGILEFADQHELLDQCNINLLITTYQIIQQIENQHKLNGVIEYSKQQILEDQMRQVTDIYNELLV